MATRRKILKSLSVLPFVGTLLGSELLQAQGTKKLVATATTRNFFKELGLRK